MPFVGFGGCQVTRSDLLMLRCEASNNSGTVGTKFQMQKNRYCYCIQTGLSLVFMKKGQEVFLFSKVMQKLRIDKQLTIKCVKKYV